MSIDGLLLDMDGVLVVSWEPLPGAVDAFAQLRGSGVAMRVITNTTSRRRITIAAELRRIGFDIADEEVLTTVVAAAAYLRAHHADERVFLLGDARPEDLEGVRLVGLQDDPDVILLSGADASFAFDNLNGVYRALLTGAAFVAMHRTLSWMTRDGECLDAGAYLQGLELATGREAVITGKPAPGFFNTGLQTLGFPAQRVAMVGDDIENDVLAAQTVGITGVLVRTGKFREDVLARATGTPDHVVNSVADIPALLGSS
jgi:HAD superfamily hydrolase (TIGR01458 family)